MRTIMGFCDFQAVLTTNMDESRRMLKAMGGGSPEGNVWVGRHCAMAVCPGEPCVLSDASALVVDGEFYNRDQWPMENLIDMFTRYGTACVDHLNGFFAFAVWHENRFYIFRDHAGAKPLFYTMRGNRFIFASELKALLRYPGVDARLDAAGLAGLLAVGPARPENSGVFKSIYALPPGCYMAVDAANGGMQTQMVRYWRMENRPHTESETETVATVRALITDAVTRQTDAGGDLCALLSGGVDSSVVTAIAAERLRASGQTLKTYSFDFKDSSKHFQANAFQPDLDKPWVNRMVDYCKTAHEYVECDADDLAGVLYDAVDARGLPGMADIDASLLFFCSRMPKGSIALTGECADEVFGGYPWFHRDDPVNGFPWSADLDARKVLLSEDLMHAVDFDGAAKRLYRDALADFESSPTWPEDEARLRSVSYLTIKWFMTTLLDRMGCMGAYTGVSGRTPFADKALMAYLWNVPWDLKRKQGVVKYLLREAARGLVPDDVLFRKKSPFPKTYNPLYEQWLKERFSDMLNDTTAPVRTWIDMKKARAFLDAPVNVSRPWFGQLMAGPQMMAYFLQINYWLKKYRVVVTI